MTEPMATSGALGHFSFEDTTPVIGREYINVNIVDDLIRTEHTEALIRDLAITS